MSHYQDLARAMLPWFEDYQRALGATIVTLKEGFPAWVQQVVYAAHDDLPPDNYRYALIRELVAAIAASEHDNRDELYVTVMNDYEPDIYNHDLIAWLASHSLREALANELLEECHITSIYEALQGGQVKEAELTLYCILEALDRVAEGNSKENGA